MSLPRKVKEMAIRCKRLLERDTNVTFPVISNPNNILAKTFLPKHSQYKLPTPDHLNKNVYDGVNSYLIQVNNLHFYSLITKEN